MNKLQKQIMIVVLVFLVLIFAVCYLFISYLNSPNRYQISLEELGIIYHCNPYFLEEASLGDVHPKEELELNTSICKHHGYYSAVKSYSKEPMQIIIDVAFLRESGPNLYTLDHQLISKYNKFTIKDDILKGTVHRLVYSLVNNQYKLVQIELL